MKYIVVQREGKEEEIFVFPRAIDHDRFRDSLMAIKFGDVNWNREYHNASNISAGFIDDGLCHGKSVSLDLKSRPAKDTMLLNKSLGI